MRYITTKLSPVDMSKVPTPGYCPLTYDELSVALDLPSGERPRIYGYLEGTDDRHGEIVAIRSHYDRERCAERLSFAWLSNSTITDLIRRA